jgi:hypothetical protein
MRLKSGFRFGVRQNYQNNMIKMLRTGRTIYDQIIFFCVKGKIVSQIQYRNQ